MADHQEHSSVWLPTQWGKEDYFKQDRSLAEWGWEYLRVNPEYQSDYRELEKSGIIRMQDDGRFPTEEGHKWQAATRKWAILLMANPKNAFNREIVRKESRGVPYWPYIPRNPIEDMEGWKPDIPGDIVFKMNTNYPIEWQLKQIKANFKAYKELHEQHLPDIKKLNHGRVLRAYHARLSGAIIEDVLEAIYSNYTDPKNQEKEYRSDIAIAESLSTTGYKKLFSL